MSPLALAVGVFYAAVLAAVAPLAGAELAHPPARTAYDEDFARRLLYLAAGAYGFSPNECIQQALPGAHQWVMLASQNETCDAFSNFCSFYAIVAEGRHEIYVVFRGTKTKKQLFIEGWQTMQPGTEFLGVGKVNKYFMRAHETLWDNVLSLLTDQKYKDFNVIFTGHSLGGALASLGALRTVLDGHRRSDQVRLYTFGQPRVGDIRLARKHDELVPNSFRVVHRLDIVPHFAACAKDKTDPRVDETSDSVPCDPEAVGIAYHHGTEIWYPNGMGESAKYYECLGTPKGEDFDCSDSLSFELSKYETYVSDHRHYFDHKVPSWGKLGCAATPAQEEAVPAESAPSLGTASTDGAAPAKPGRFAQAAHFISQLISGRRRRRHADPPSSVNFIEDQLFGDI